MTSPLERLYPNRCYDCLAVVSSGGLLCAECEALYAAERGRRKNQSR
jgi:hypothetical protein